ncbi:hypothetical protein HYDPIDRAFT_34227 [Hydnomerulius pinastri MD-312]|uniref:Uncharacterized protein n=1 Tax=Hydnomerulius pinastri MD-312 TaxID=994086 RepID=A0A0C9W7G7_9AGAM|nr:hypothetical protein HYDPIDRAFT_34227 [Hydnomerulius pinastri MD-312]
MSPTKSALTLLPQLPLSSSLPTSASTPSVTPSTSTTPSATTTSTSTTNPRAPSHSLLSTRDPLSLPIMTSDFRCFVAQVGDVFWLQDRVEEVMLWKKGWKRTTAWLAVYGSIIYLVGAFSDAHDAILPLFPLLTPPPTSQPPAPPPPSPTRSHFTSASLSTSTFPPPSPSPHAVHRLGSGARVHEPLLARASSGAGTRHTGPLFIMVRIPSSKPPKPPTRRRENTVILPHAAFDPRFNAYYSEQTACAQSAGVG